MNFKEWVGNQSSIVQEVENTLKIWKRQILSSMRSENGRIMLQFPKNIELSNLQRINPASVPVSTTIAAGMEYTGNVVQEGRPKTASDEDWEHRHDKGWLAYKGLQKIVDPATTLGWDKKQQYRFKSNLTYSIKDIAQALGFLFEIDVFLYLRDIRKFHDGDNGAMNVEEQRKNYEQVISIRTGSARDLIFQMVSIHVKDLSEQIITRTERILGCADMVWFQGGSTSNWQGRSDPADIVVGCSTVAGEEDRVGYSIKFGSETKISIANLGLPSVVNVLTKKMLPNQVKKLTNIEQNEEWSVNVIVALKEMAERFEDNPKAFVDLLNDLLTGSKFTFPAARNYASTDGGGAEWSENFKKDFVVSDNPRKPLLARREATVEVDTNQTYLRMTYKVKGGSFSGTTLFFIPRQGKVDVKVTNLTSSRR